MPPAANCPAAYYLACRKCHSDNYDRTLDSMHAQAAAAGNLDAPGLHRLPRRARRPPARISRARISRKSAANATLRSSPDYREQRPRHGLDPGGQPGRAGVHRLPRRAQHPGSAHGAVPRRQRRSCAPAATPIRSAWANMVCRPTSTICTRCRGMGWMSRSTKPTGRPSGTTAPSAPIAMACTTSAARNDPASRVNPANLLATCRKCHPDAGPNWTGAWTGHNQVSRERTPFVFYTQAFYHMLHPVRAVALGRLRGPADHARRGRPR